jgi:hypothetical protein
MFRRIKNWIMLRLAIWRINSLQRTIKKFGNLDKFDKSLDELSREVGCILWCNVNLGLYDNSCSVSQEDVERVASIAQQRAKS